MTTDGAPRARERAPAKINLFLHVLGRRPDGFHDLDSLVAFAEVHDVVELTAADTFSLAIDGPFAPALADTQPDNNLALRAARAAAAGTRTAFAIRLTKNLPVAAGLGGGSADAAAV
ncbi:MAG: 4-(cytidine 5'-diphospho)-2-C-methyl-D-erythritol kinase, partial [Proteobacteria bacterium]|nr:4-(cytidine 5'-diphospho)-2-C-methyl-D-erythritol kinase [Pseudomonadota bacterium]